MSYCTLKYSHFAVVKIMLMMVEEPIMLIMMVKVLMMKLMLIKILDCHSSHRPTQSGQAKSCHKSDCLLISW